MEDNNIKIDEDELYKQLVEEVAGQEHSMIVTIAVPNLSVETFLKPKSKMLDCKPVIHVTDGDGGTNAMTRAMTVIALKETADAFLEDKNVNEAYTVLKLMTRQERHGGKHNDTD